MHRQKHLSETKAFRNVSSLSKMCQTAINYLSNLQHILQSQCEYAADDTEMGQHNQSVFDDYLWKNRSNTSQSK